MQVHFLCLYIYLSNYTAPLRISENIVNMVTKVLKPMQSKIN